MTQDAMQAVITRNAFYRRLHYYALAVFAVAIVVIGILIGMLCYISGNYHHPLYFATDNVGRLIKIIPVSQPNMSEEDMFDWAVEAVQSAYSYDYLNYNGQLQRAQKYFTTYGWSKYMTALTASNNLLGIKQYKMVAIATVVGKPTVLQRGLVGGAYAWQLKMPLLVTYLQPPYDDTGRYSNSIEITVIVQRQHVLQSYKGLAILQIIGEVAKAPVPATPPLTTTSI